jgi:hypothetical protein
LDRLNFRILLQVSAVTAFFAIIPFPMHVLFEADAAWRASLLIYGIFHVFDVGSFILKLPKEALPINRVLSRMGLIVAMAQIVVGIFSGSTVVEFTYLAALVWHLSVAFAGFVILIYAIRGVSTDQPD